jgi:DNA-binding IclR family transcriptional regulator
VQRLLASLEREGFVYQDPNSRRYSLGLARLAVSALHRSDPTDRAVPALRALHGACGERLSLQPRGGFERIGATELQRAHPLRMAASVGRVLTLCRGAAGKAILAFLPVAEQDEALAARPNETAMAACLADLKACARTISALAGLHRTVVVGG